MLLLQGRGLHQEHALPQAKHSQLGTCARFIICEPVTRLITPLKACRLLPAKSLRACVLACLLAPNQVLISWFEKVKEMLSPTFEFGEALADHVLAPEDVRENMDCRSKGERNRAKFRERSGKGQGKVRERSGKVQAVDKARSHTHSARWNVQASSVL